MKSESTTRFVRIRCHASPGQTPVYFQWRVVEVDRLWKSVQMPTNTECCALMEHHLRQQLGDHVQIVRVEDSYGNVESALHPDVIRSYEAARAADALRGITD